MAESRRKPTRRGKPSPRLPAAKQIERDYGVVHDKLIEGMSWLEVGKKYGIKERTGRAILQRWREDQHETLTDLDPMVEIMEMIQTYDSLVSNYMKTRRVAEEKENFSIVLGANGGIARTVERKAELMQASGLLPKNLGKIQIEYDIRYLAAVIWEVFQKYEVPEQARVEIKTALRRRIATQTPAAAALN